jgi:hypothetical protein
MGRVMSLGIATATVPAAGAFTIKDSSPGKLDGGGGRAWGRKGMAGRCDDQITKHFLS